MRAWNYWTPTQISTLRKSWHTKTDREIAKQLGRSLYSVRSYRVQNIARRRPSLRDRWQGKPGRALSRSIAAEYKHGTSQTDLVEKHHLEWRKLKEILLSQKSKIRDKSQQAFMGRYGKLPRIRECLSPSKLYVIFAMLGDNLRPTSQTMWGTHIIGIIAGSDRDFAQCWIENFEREFRVRPRLLIKSKNNIQAYISLVDIWRELHQYAVFGSRQWRLKPSTMRFLTERLSLGQLGYAIRGFFDAEGYVSLSRTKTAGSVSVTSVNYRGLKQISLLLAKVGIRHHFHKRNLNQIGLYSRADLKDYQERVGFSISRKSVQLDRVVRAYEKDRASL